MHVKFRKKCVYRISPSTRSPNPIPTVSLDLTKQIKFWYQYVRKTRVQYEIINADKSITIPRILLIYQNVLKILFSNETCKPWNLILNYIMNIIKKKKKPIQSSTMSYHSYQQELRFIKINTQTIRFSFSNSIELTYTGS